MSMIWITSATPLADPGKDRPRYWMQPRWPCSVWPRPADLDAAAPKTAIGRRSRSDASRIRHEVYRRCDGRLLSWAEDPPVPIDAVD